jgi:uncharacterized protein
MSQRIDRDTGRFREKLKEAVRKNLKDYLTDDSIVGRKNGKPIKIRLPGIQIPRFWPGGKGQGTGQGNGEVGDPTSGKGKKGKGKEGDAGQDPDDNHMPEAEIDKADLAAILAEELELPNIEQKGSDETTRTSNKYSGVQKEGPRGLRIGKRTFKNAIKRAMASGDLTDKNLGSFPIPIRPDMRFKSPKEVVEPQVKVCLIYIRDYSGSMTPEMCYLVRSVCFWIDAYLETQYGGSIKSHFLLHDTICKETDAETFYTLTTGGGTQISSAYEQAYSIIESGEAANYYLVQGTDGDNFGSDNEKCIQLLKDKILPACNLMMYAQTREGEYINWLKENFATEPKVIAEMMLDRDAILPAIRSFLGTGK